MRQRQHEEQPVAYPEPRFDHRPDVPTARFIENPVSPVHIQCEALAVIGADEGPELDVRGEFVEPARHAGLVGIVGDHRFGADMAAHADEVRVTRKVFTSTAKLWKWSGSITRRYSVSMPTFQRCHFPFG